MRRALPTAIIVLAGVVHGACGGDDEDAEVVQPRDERTAVVDAVKALRPPHSTATRAATATGSPAS